MTVALLGVGADSTNAAPTPPVYADGRFEYIPIPEANGPTGTTEHRTYGTTSLSHQNRSMAAFLDTIWPRPWKDNESYTGEALADWPLHYDPNFEALTYGETTSRGAYTSLLSSLDSGDGVAFYTGLSANDSSYRHRYLIGYFTVSEIVDFRTLKDSKGFQQLPADRQRQLIDEHAQNAHAKRFAATGQLQNGDGLVIVDGTRPGGRLDQAIQISKRKNGGHYYLTDRYQELLCPTPGGNPDRNAYLGGIKPAHELELGVDAVQEIIQNEQS